jgi:predicted amidohydrolase YtcJ
VSSAVTSRSIWRSVWSIDHIAPRGTLAALAAGGAVLAACGGPQTVTDRTADLVLVGGDVITMDDTQPAASAIAIDRGRIVAVGNAASVQGWIGEGTRVVELDGRSVTPGWVDAHCHLFGLGGSLENVSLRGLATRAEAVQVVAAAAAGRAEGEWVLGRGWDQNLWGGEFPNRADLDAVVGDRPVALRRVDGHAVWVSSAALALGGVTRDTRDPDGGKILRDGKGEPTGVLVDNAMDLVETHIPAPTDAVIERLIRLAAAYAIERGLTGVHEMGIEPATADVYRRLAAAGELPLRVTAYASGDPAVAKQLAATPPTELDDGFAWFSMRGVKLYADGALGSRGAALGAEYSDDPGNHGNWVTSPEDLRVAIADLAAGGWQIAIHAIGDAAIHEVLDGYEAAIGANPGSDLRLRVEHVQVIAAADVPRFAKLGVLASMQPTHATSDMPWAEQRVGAARVEGAYAWRTLIEAGATIVGGSDFPVEEVAPLLGLYAAVTRQDPDGNPPGGWYPGQRMTLEEAIHAFTVAPAFAGFVEGARGKVKVGMAADLTVVDRKLEAGPGLLETQVDLTVVGGRVVFERK